MNNHNNNITALIIAAGFSSRMKKFKPLLKYKGKSFIQNIAAKFSLITNRIIIVTGYNSNLLEEHIAEWQPELKNKTQIIFNNNFEEGMFVSLKKGVENCKTNWLLYHFVDQPNIPEKFYYEFTQQSREEYDWLQPLYKGRKGHPIIFNKKVMEIILSGNDNSNLKEISMHDDIKKKYWECKFNEVLNDFDTVSDLDKL